jgi:hypothetical protein
MIVQDGLYGEFRTEVKIQALDFLLRYPDFFACELIKVLDERPGIDQREIELIVKGIFKDSEPEIRTEEMQKFFHGAYESIDDAIAYLFSIGFIKYSSRRRVDGKEFDKIYWTTESIQIQSRNVSNQFRIGYLVLQPMSFDQKVFRNV